MRGELLTELTCSWTLLNSIHHLFFFVLEGYLGQPVKNAVVTVPAYFNDSQRQVCSTDLSRQIVMRESGKVEVVITS